MNKFNTPIVKLSNINKILDRDNIYLKLESTNSVSHTFKDRGALGVIKQMQKQNKTLILAGTCSNMGVAVSGMAAKYGIDSIVVASSSAPIGMINMMKKFSKKCIVINGGFDEVDAFISLLSKKYPNIACVNTNYNKFFFKGYYSIMDELSLQLDKNKIYNIIVPTADGTLLSSLYNRYMKLSKKIDMPKIRFHLVQPSGCSPIVDAINNNHKIKALKKSNTNVVPLSVKNPIQCGNDAIKAVLNTNGYAIKIKESKVNKFTNILTKNEGIYSDMVGGVLMGAIYKLSQKIDKNEVILGIYTGNGLVYSCEDNTKIVLSNEEAEKQVLKLLEEKKDV